MQLKRSLPRLPIRFRSKKRKADGKQSSPESAGVVAPANSAKTDPNQPSTSGEADENASCFTELRTVHLHADVNVAGQLAFRLVGNRASGVFVMGTQQTSQQAKVLDDGDKLLLCNGVPLSGFTCEQVANVLRLTLCHDGTLTLTTRRNVEIKQKLEQRKSKRTHCHEESSCFDSHPIRISSPLHTREYSARCVKPGRGVATFETAESDDSTRRGGSSMSSGVSAFFSSISLFSHRRGTREERRPITARDTVTYLTPEAHTEAGDVIRVDSRFRCPICLKYTSVRRLHMLKHDWANGARRLIPASTSEFFVRRSTSDYVML